MSEQSAIMPTLSPGRGSDAQRQAKKQAILRALSMGHTRTAASALGNITRETFYDWLKADPAFSDEVTRAEANAEDYYLEAIYHAAKADPKNAVHAQWWLERRRARDYGRTERLTILRDIQRDIEKLSDDELAAVAYGSDDDGSAGAVP